MHYFYIIRYDTHGLPLWGQIALYPVGFAFDPFAFAVAASRPVWAV